MKKRFNKIKVFINKNKVLSITIFIIFILVIIFLIIFKIKGYDFINYRTLTYKRTENCNDNFILSDTKNYNLYNIIKTTEYKEKIWVLNNSDIETLTIKSFKGSPTKEGKAEISVIDCKNKTTRTLKGRYKKYKKNYIVVYLNDELFLYYFDKKENNLKDYFNYKKGRNIKYTKVK